MSLLRRERMENVVVLYEQKSMKRQQVTSFESLWNLTRYLLFFCWLSQIRIQLHIVTLKSFPSSSNCIMCIMASSSSSTYIDSGVWGKRSYVFYQKRIFSRYRDKAFAGDFYLLSRCLRRRHSGIARRKNRCLMWDMKDNGRLTSPIIRCRNQRGKLYLVVQITSVILKNFESTLCGFEKGLDLVVHE